MPPVPDPVDGDDDGGALSRGDEGPGVIDFASDDTDSDSCSSDVDATTAGYVQLSQGPDDSDEESSSAGGEVERADNSRVSDVKKDMPADHVDQIKSVMANIKLPNIPEWADKIPETQWMGQLFTKIQRNKEGTTPDNKQNPTNTQDCSSGTTTNSTGGTVTRVYEPGSNFADFEANFPS